MRINILQPLLSLLAAQQAFKLSFATPIEASSSFVNNELVLNRILNSNVQNLTSNYFNTDHDLGFIYNHEDFEYIGQIIKARVLAKNSRLDDALNEINIINDLYPKDPEVLLCKAHILYAMGRLKDAITTLDRYDPSYHNDDLSPTNQFQDDNQIIILKTEILSNLHYNDDASVIGNNTNYNDYM